MDQDLHVHWVLFVSCDVIFEYISIQIVFFSFGMLWTHFFIVEMYKMNTPGNIFLDLSKDFDTLNRKILLDKFEHCGVNGISLRLIESYLTNRKQYVEIDGSNSDMLCLTTCVPQGSILGPLLFIIYINDISQARKLFDFIIYTDDTTLSTTSEIVIRNTPNLNADNILNTELKNVSDWLKLNKLSLNLKKCKYMIFHTTEKK